VGKGRPKTNDSSQAKSTSKSNKKKQKIVWALGAAAQDDDDKETDYSEDKEWVSKRAFQALWEQSLQLAVYGIALIIVLIYVSFYANDGRKHTSYVLKSRRLKRRIWRLALLKAWTKTIWHAIEGQVWKLKTKREFRRWLKIIHKYKANTRFKHKRIRRIQRQLGNEFIMTWSFSKSSWQWKPTKTKLNAKPFLIPIPSQSE
jgi:hypothetical protein